MTATVVVVLLALFWLAPWQRPLRLPFASLGSSGPVPLSSAPDPNAPGAGQGQTTDPRQANLSSPPRANTDGPAAAPQVATLGSAAPRDGKAGTEGAQPVTAMRQPQALDNAGSTAPAIDRTPSFDIVRVEPTGETVIAGRAMPDSDITLMDGDKPVGHVHVDASGQFAIVPDSLSAGSHYLTLQAAKSGEAAARSAQGVAVSVAKGGQTKALVALLAPDKPAQVLSDGAALPAGTAHGAATNGAPVSMAIQTVEAGQGGRFTATGVAHPGSQCRVYLNGAYLADVTAGQDGHWSVEIKKGMKPGRYTVRADEMTPVGDKVAHRAEVPFDYPVASADRAAGAGKQLLMARASPSTKGVKQIVGTSAESRKTVASIETATPAAQTPAPSAGPGLASQPRADATGKLAAVQGGTASDSASPLIESGANAAAVIADLHTTTVLHGDSLWRISRKMLGHGIQYTEIYASNVSQIRDPSLIYPGQIFVVPSQRPN